MIGTLRRRANLNVRDLGSEMILFDETSETYHVLNTTARQIWLWVEEDGEKDRRFRAALRDMARERDDDGWTLATPPVGQVGILTWSPPSVSG